MSYSRFVIIWCDYDDGSGPCGESIDAAYFKVQPTRRAIRDDGWTYQFYKDLCPKHNLESAPA